MIRTLPAVYQEIYVADAADRDEAQRALAGGRAQCQSRQFVTRPNTAQPAAFPLQILEEPAALPPDDFPFADPLLKRDATFNNAVFTSAPGHELQHAVQVLDS
jgi:hypothetical protein